MISTLDLETNLHAAAAACEDWREAMLLSILKWQFLVEGLDIAKGVYTCALCQLTERHNAYKEGGFKFSCKGCPIANYLIFRDGEPAAHAIEYGECMCERTPYAEVPVNATAATALVGMQDELAFLRQVYAFNFGETHPFDPKELAKLRKQVEEGVYEP